jgi:hypothetical protein
MIPQIIGEQGLLWYLVSFASLIIFFTLWSKLQFFRMLKEIESKLMKIEVVKEEAFKTAVKTVKDLGKKERDPTPFVKRFTDYTFIEPTGLDPAGIVWKLDHLLNVREARFRSEIKKVAPKATTSQLNNLENLLEAAQDLNLIYKIVRHYYLLGKKTKNLYIVIQVQLIMPMIMRIVEAYAGAVHAFSKGCPIGDGAGALVAAKLMKGSRVRKLIRDVVFSKVKIDGRNVFILKSEGPGGNVGKPGDALRTLIEKLGGNVNAIIMVDAAVKFEGEKTGAVSEGIGAAIGGIGTEKFKIEEVALKYKIPLNAVLVKQSLQEAISPMKREIVEGIEEAVNVVKRIINERTKRNDTVIVAGVGNTIGIGQ